MDAEIKAYVMAALESYRGDDLERTERSWFGMSEAQMQQVDGFGMTRAQILDNCRRIRALHNKAVDAVRGLL